MEEILYQLGRNNTLSEGDNPKEVRPSLFTHESVVQSLHTWNFVHVWWLNFCIFVHFLSEIFSSGSSLLKVGLFYTDK